jgi:uncharacterized protein YodC (DUF2158 family)
MYEVGDVVRLKSGGPKMTVTEVNRPNVVCSWFDGNELSYGTFDAMAVERSI